MGALKQKKRPLVSIITPSYNQGCFIEQTIKSVLSQNYKNIEYIVIDGGSTDTTLDILNKYNGQFTWISEPDRGQADAINKGLKMAKGELLAWLNSDDTYLPGAIKKVVRFMQKHPEYKMVYGEGYYISKNSKIINRYPTEPFDYWRLSQTCYICQPTVFFTRDVFENIGYLDVNLKACLDYDYWIRIGSQFKVAKIDEYLAAFRIHSNNKTITLKKLIYREIFSIVKKYYGVVSIAWTYGYSDFLIYGSNYKYKRPWPDWIVSILAILLFIYHNYYNPKFLFNDVKYLLKNMVKLKRYNYSIKDITVWINENQ
ncbi:MAG: glycosyltransferase family 2 protein [bacterium]